MRVLSRTGSAARVDYAANASLVVSVVSAPAASDDETLTITVIGGVSLGDPIKAKAKKEARKINKRKNHKKFDCVQYGLSPYGYETDVDPFDRVNVTDESGKAVAPPLSYRGVGAGV